jgi:hypothetical protein
MPRCGGAGHGADRQGTPMESWTLSDGRTVAVVWSKDKRSAELLLDGIRFDLIYAIIRANETLWFSLHEPTRECGSAEQAITNATYRLFAKP